jgi:hypothetical protein
MPAGFSKPQLGQCMQVPSGTAVRVVGVIGAEARRPSLISMGWLVCQYSRAGPVSSEKHEGTPGTEVEGRSGDASGIRTATVEWAATILGLRR